MHKPAVSTDAFLDAAGAPSIPEDVIRVCKYHAKLVITAVYYAPVPLSLGTMLTSELTITTAVEYPTEMPDVVASMARLKSKIQTMISHRIPFENVIEGLKLAGTPESAKVMVHMEEAGA